MALARRQMIMNKKEYHVFQLLFLFGLFQEFIACIVVFMYIISCFYRVNVGMGWISFREQLPLGTTPRTPCRSQCIPIRETPGEGVPKQNHDNIIYLTGQPKDGSPSAPSLAEGMGYMMVTYNDLFTFVIMLCAVITLVGNFKHKK